LARVVTGRTGTRKYDHITPALINLHWLPVRERITFKVATLAFKTIQSGQPPYLASLIQRYHPTRQLRSASEVRLQPLELRIARKVITTRAFSAAVPTVWIGMMCQLILGLSLQLPHSQLFASTTSLKGPILHVADHVHPAPTIHPSGTDIWRVISLFTYLLTYLSGFLYTNCPL
jgi:hypothetical protein